MKDSEELYGLTSDDYKIFYILGTIRGYYYEKQNDAEKLHLWKEGESQVYITRNNLGLKVEQALADWMEATSGQKKPVDRHTISKWIKFLVANSYLFLADADIDRAPTPTTRYHLYYKKLNEDFEKLKDKRVNFIKSKDKIDHTHQTKL